MVQYKSYSHWSCNDNDGYWKLDGKGDKTIAQRKTLLTEKGYHCQAQINKASALDAYGRCQRGILSYRGYDLTTLREFCVNRGLPESLSGRKSRASLVRVLENADDNATLEKLFELPPELRDMVYKFHFESFDKLYYNYRQPPPLLASSRLRQEPLACFYRYCSLPLAANWSVGRDVRQPRKPQPSYDSNTMTMVEGIADKNFGFIRRVAIHFDVIPRRQGLFHIHIDLSPNIGLEAAVCVRRMECDYSSRYLEAPHYEKDFEAAIRSFLSEFETQRDGCVLQKIFMERLLEAMGSGIRSAEESMTGSA